jgi:carboxypeptidase Q
LTDFTQILFSSRADFVSFVPVVAIPNLGCSDADWANVSATGAIALVMRGSCPYVEKSALAEKYQARGLLIYNDGLRSGNLQPIQGARNNLNTTIPAYFLSYDLGIQLANPRVIMNIDIADIEGVANICTDTPSGDKTKTIVIGSHSDEVPAGSGINDNGKRISIY